MDATICDVLTAHMPPGTFGLARLAYVCAIVIERMHSVLVANQTLEQKLDQATQIAEQVVACALRHGYCTEAQAAKITADLKTFDAEFDRLLQVYHELAQNPTVLKIEQEVEQVCKACMKKTK